MTYIVNDKCIKCKLMDCIEVCPVSCFYEGENMLVINPEECIDCGICEPACPIEAIQSDNDKSAIKWIEMNNKYSKIWPRITEKGTVPQDSEKYIEVKDKFEKYFDENIKK